MSEKPNMIPIDHDKPRKKFLGLTLPKTPEEVVKEYVEQGRRDPRGHQKTQGTFTKDVEYSKDAISERAMPSYLLNQMTTLGGFSTNPEVRDKANSTIRMQQEKDSEVMAWGQGSKNWSKDDLKNLQSKRLQDLREVDKKNNLIGTRTNSTREQSLFFQAVKNQSGRTNGISQDTDRQGRLPPETIPTGSFNTFPLNMVTGIPTARFANSVKPETTLKGFSKSVKDIFNYFSKPKQQNSLMPTPSVGTEEKAPSPAPSPAPTPTEKPERPKAPLAPPPKPPPLDIGRVEKTGDTNPNRFNLPKPQKLIRDPITGMWKDAPKEEPKSKYETFQFPEGTKLAGPLKHPPKPDIGFVPRIGPTAEQYEAQQRLIREQAEKFPKPEPRPTEKQEEPLAPTPAPTPTQNNTGSIANIPTPPAIGQDNIKDQTRLTQIKPLIGPPASIIPSLARGAAAAGLGIFGLIQALRGPITIPKPVPKPIPKPIPVPVPPIPNPVPPPPIPVPVPPKNPEDIIRDEKDPVPDPVPNPIPKPVPPVPPVPDPKPPEKKDPKKPNPMDFAMMLPTQGSVSSFPSMVTGIPTHSAPSFEKTQLEINYYSELGF